MSVYFITCREQGVVKIGIARDPEARLASLQTAAPGRLKIEATMCGGRTEEMALHNRFAEHRTQGEWFTLAEEIDALIRQTGRAELPVDAEPRFKPKTDEELAEESILLERQVFAEHMSWRERLDAGALDLGQPRTTGTA